MTRHSKLKLEYQYYAITFERTVLFSEFSLILLYMKLMSTFHSFSCERRVGTKLYARFQVRGRWNLIFGFCKTSTTHYTMVEDHQMRFCSSRDTY